MNKLSSTQAPLEFNNVDCYIRQILLLSCLSGRQVIIKNIRSEETNPGLEKFELDLLDLIQKVTNGSHVNIGKTGTKLIFKPGIVDCHDGLPVEHQCDLARSCTYYLEVVSVLAIFGKSQLNLKLYGNTDDSIDQSVESFGRVMDALLKHVGGAQFDLKVRKRGYAPLGGGEVTLQQGFCRKLDAVTMIDEGKIKRVRGWVTSAKVSPQLTTRVVDKIREVFNDYIPDVWIHTDHYKKGQCGDQAGYAVSLLAETTTGVVLTKDFRFDERFKLPEELGQHVAYSMLDEIFTGGVVDSSNQGLLLMLAALSSGDNVSQVKLARVTQQTVTMLRHLKSFFNLEFKITECEEDNVFESDSDEEEQVAVETKSFPKAFLFSCIGVGLTNLARKTE